MARAFSTQVKLYDNIPITDGLNISFSSRSAQSAYFASKPGWKTPATYSFVRHTQGYLDIDVQFGDALMSNYVSFDNGAHTPATFYCRVSDVEYINEGTTRVHFVVDAWQTFMFNAAYQPCHVERQHPTAEEHASVSGNPYQDGRFFLYTNEGLPTTPDLYVNGKRDRALITDKGLPDGDPRGGSGAGIDSGGVSGIAKQFGGSRFTGATNPYPMEIAIMVAHSEATEEAFRTVNAMNISGKWPNVFTNLYFGGMSGQFFSGHDLIVIRGETVTSGTEKNMAGFLEAYLEEMTRNGLDSAIISMWALPVGMSDLTGGTPTYNVEEVHTDSGPSSSTSYGNVVGYEPVMKKLYRSPFRSLVVTSPTGEEHSYAFELSDTFSPTDNTAKRISLMMWRLADDIPSQVVAPIQYGGSSAHLTDKMVFSSYPQLSYTTDGFLTYMAAQYQNVVTTTSTKDRVMGQSGIQAMNNALGNFNYGGISNIRGGLNNAAAGVAGFFGADGLSNMLSDRAEGFSLANEADLNDKNMSQNVIDYMRGDTPTNPLGHHQDAFGLDHYHAGNAANSIHTRTSNDWWTIEVRTLSKPVLEAYDYFLRRYGYTYDEQLVPNIMLRRDGTNPSFIDGYSYAKTQGAKVHGIPDQYARQIAAMFDGGVRFTDGG